MKLPSPLRILLLAVAAMLCAPALPAETTLLPLPQEKNENQKEKGAKPPRPEDWNEHPWEGELHLGFSDQFMEFMVGVTWYPWRFVGLSADVGLVTDLEDAGHLVFDTLQQWPENYHNGYYMNEANLRAVLQPSVVALTPALLIIDSWQMDLKLFARGGATLATPASGSKHSRWLYGHIGGGVALTFGESFVLKGGYTFTNFDLDDGSYYDQWGTLVRVNHTTHMGYVSFAYRF